MTARWLAPAGLHTSSARLPVEGKLPSFDGATGWLNSPPLTATDLSGKIIVVNFWTYTCINWLRQLPCLCAWAEKYAGHRLALIGVHTPEFGFEHNLDNVRRAVHDMRIGYPVAVDNGRAATLGHGVLACTGLQHNAPRFRDTRSSRYSLRCRAAPVRAMGARWGAIIGRHQATSGRLKCSITEV